jgi:hypothetical protein
MVPHRLRTAIRYEESKRRAGEDWSRSNSWARLNRAARSNQKSPTRFLWCVTFLSQPKAYPCESITRASVDDFFCWRAAQNPSEIPNRGYEETSIRAIVAKARVNQAAINYHFGGKDGLYREVLRAAIRALTERQLGQAEEMKRMSRENALGEFIRHQLHPLAVHDDFSRYLRIFNWEAVRPTAVYATAPTECQGSLINDGQTTRSTGGDPSCRCAHLFLMSPCRLRPFK